MIATSFPGKFPHALTESNLLPRKFGEEIVFVIKENL